MKRVLVTGGGSGIGRGLAQAFADAGHAVTITGRRADALTETASGRDMTYITADVCDETAIDALFEQPFDVVVANAGMGRAAPLTDVSLDDWNQTLAVNLTGTFLTFRGALRTMKAGGRLIAIASTAGLQGGPRIGAYCASKHGVIGLVRSVAQEVASAGITCNAVCPGFVETDMAKAAVASVMQARRVDEARATKMVVSGNPMGRMIDVDEVVSAALYLASDGASSINGHALSVSGGEI
ncbi:SDR family NAD(P)-dependent oxidoreductase [Ascidiaceihabitans sp.]|uniref:SDR family NAD(P)-dependent oxidoreductase n=1 Tax=Ascidiaceihabitans sp. TaxID=1872644 RepID=UPI003298A47F